MIEDVKTSNLKLGFVLFIVLVLLSFSTKSAQARRWVLDERHNWTIDENMVCRDGVVVMAYDDTSYEPPDSSMVDPIDPYPYFLQARLFTTDGLFPPDHVFGGDFAESYGPALTPNQSFILNYHRDEDGKYVPIYREEGDKHGYYLYFIENLNWSRVLDVGTKIIVEGGGYPLDGTVSDCYLNQFEVPQWGTSVITTANLNSAFGPIKSDSVVYKIDQLPTYGTLYLNGSPLATGDTFTQNDVDTSLLKYSHNGMDLESDKFSYTVMGTTRVSVSSALEQGNGTSFDPSIVGDGSIVAFTSNATNLIPNDQNNYSDIFVRVNDSETHRVSSPLNGEEANGNSFNSVIQGGSQTIFRVVFESDANNIGNTSSCSDINSVRDIYESYSGGSIEIVSYIWENGNCVGGNDNSYAPAIPDNSFDTVFETELNNWEEDTNNASDIIILPSSSTSIVSRAYNNDDLGNDGSFAAAISNSQKEVVFQSLASNLIMTDTNGLSDIFLRSGTSTTRVSVGINGKESNGASFDPDISSFFPEYSKRYIVYESDATNLIEKDTNNARDIFLFDQETGVTTRVSIASDGSEANGDSTNATISANGRYVAFFSTASNLVSNDDNEAGDIFIRDLQTGITKIISIAYDGTLGNNSSFSPSISNDGDYIAFHSDASNLVSDDTNGVQDVFVHYVGYSDDFHIKVNLLHEKTFIPVVQRNFVNGPDLVISNLSLSNNNIEITLQNIGYSPVRSGFWVDLYISPDIVPTKVNQIWPNLGDYGAVWGVDDDSFLLNVGETITLKIDDKYYFSGLSNLPNLIASGTAIYAQVDSANANTNYGAVLETHEIVNGQYNNIIGVIVTSPIILARPEPYIAPIYLEKELPQRQHGVKR